jgi:hypothetical protein
VRSGIDRRPLEQARFLRQGVDGRSGDTSALLPATNREGPLSRSSLCRGEPYDPSWESRMA